MYSYVCICMYACFNVYVCMYACILTYMEKGDDDEEKEEVEEEEEDGKNEGGEIGLDRNTEATKGRMRKR